MASYEINFFSASLKRCVPFRAFIPNDQLSQWIEYNPNYKRETKTLFLLHGYMGNDVDWGFNSLAAELSTTYNLAIIMPSGENSFYLNAEATGHKYEDYVGTELPEYVHRVFGLSDKPSDNYICGLSMGGFGAIHTALAHPETFGKMMGLSSALICDGLNGMKDGDDNGMANYAYYEYWFGPLDKIDESHNNPKFLVKERLAKGEKIQPVYIAIGTEDFLIEPNHNFKAFLDEKKVEVTYVEDKGVHDWKFWNKYLEPAIKWALEI